MPEDKTIVCNSCIHRIAISICRVCMRYPGNTNCVDLYEDDRIKAENLEIKDGKFFSITELNGNVIFLLKNQHVDNVVIQIPLTLTQCNIIQRHLFRIIKLSKEKANQQQALTTKITTEPAIKKEIP